MKYYFNGELVRTSKNENYRFYCPLTKTCSKTSAGALSQVNYILRLNKQNMDYYKKALAKIEKGVLVKNCVTGRNYTIDELQKYIEICENTIKQYSNAQVVEIEARP